MTRVIRLVYKNLAKWGSSIYLTPNEASGPQLGAYWKVVITHRNCDILYLAALCLEETAIPPVVVKPHSICSPDPLLQLLTSMAARKYIVQGPRSCNPWDNIKSRDECLMLSGGLGHFN